LPSRAGRPAVVLGLRPAGLAVARALAHEGVPVAGIALGRDEWGLASRHLLRRWRIDEPDTDRRDDRVVEALAELARHGRPVVIPEIDKAVAVIVRRWEDVTAVADVPLPADPDTVRRLALKDTLLAEAERAGVQTPRTVVPENEDAVRSAELPLPFLVKPVESEEYARHFTRKVVVAHDIEDAVEAWRTAHAAGFAVVLQERIPGRDRVFSLFAYIGREGEPLASVVGRKLRQIPPDFGSSTVFRLEREPRVLELGQRLLASSSYRGFAHVEFVHDARSDSFRLLEVNTRLPVWAGIAMRPGWDVARLAYEDLIGAGPAPLGTLDHSGIWVYAVKDAWVVAGMAWRRELGVRDVVAPYRDPRRVGAVLARDDVRPALAFVRWAGGLALRRSARRLLRLRVPTRRERATDAS
jgi:predicted ATP-grasp superfamily ATP-dependent carboligase